MNSTIQIFGRRARAARKPILLAACALPAMAWFCYAAADPADHSLRNETARDLSRVIRPEPGRFTLPEEKLLLKESLDAVRRSQKGAYGAFEFWRVAGLDMTAIDHAGHFDELVTGAAYDQYGPPRTSRALAMLQIASFEAANQFAPQSRHAESWLARQHHPLPSANGLVEEAVINGAAYTALTLLYPTQLPLLAPLEQEAHNRVINEHPGISPHLLQASEQYGAAITNAVLAVRRAAEPSCIDLKAPVKQGDGNFPPHNDAYSLGCLDADWAADPVYAWQPKRFAPLQPSANGVYPPTQWTADPVSDLTLVLGANWRAMPSFTGLNAGDAQFQLDPPPAPNSPLFRSALGEVLTVGGDPEHRIPRNDTPAHDRYYRAKFWAYDATAGLCAPVRLYAQIAAKVLETYPSLAPDVQPGQAHARSPGGDAAATVEAARYFALVHASLADAAIVAWSQKYKYQFWRPVTGIRTQESDERQKSGIPQAENTRRHPLWYPLGAQTTNAASGYNITPPFPSYPSGHAVFGGALFQLLRQLVPGDQGFAIRSDEYNGAHSFSKNVDPYGYVRCAANSGDNPYYCRDVRFGSFDEAETDNALSRLWMGVHWRFDASCGTAIGETVGYTVYDTAFRLDHAPHDPRAKGIAALANCQTQMLDDSYLRNLRG